MTDINKIAQEAGVDPDHPGLKNRIANGGETTQLLGCLKDPVQPAGLPGAVKGTKGTVRDLLEKNFPALDGRGA